MHGAVVSASQARETKVAAKVWSCRSIRVYLAFGALPNDEPGLFQLGGHTAGGRGGRKKLQRTVHEVVNLLLGYGGHTAPHASLQIARGVSRSQ